jgi:lipopolysaccharide biosynthesis regulator YciM
MSQTPTISQPPPEPLTSTPSRLPPPPPPEALAVLEGTVRRLRTELAATGDRARHARLLAEIADLEERSGDEPAAARDYLAAYNADSTFREPLEGLVRLLEKRRSLKNLGKLVDALARVATSPDERVRALLMRAAYQADVSSDLGEAKSAAREATEVEGAPVAEQASAWLALEVLAGRTGDTAARDESLTHRARFAADPTWHALLLLDGARIAAAAGEVERAVQLAQEARALASEATWTATAVLEQVVHDHPGIPGTDEARTRAEAHADALDATAALLEEALTDAARGDALGVPRWVREPARRVDAWLRAAEARRRLGQIDRAAATLDRALEQVAAMPAEEAALAEAAVITARIRIAEQKGDTATGARLAERRLATEKNPGLAAALAMRVAEHAAAEGDSPKALEALSRAITNDPGSLPARALQLDMLADGGDPGAFAGQLESFAEHLGTDEARGRAFLLAAFVWAVRANDTAGAKAALSQAAMYGVAPAVTGRLARALASIAGDTAWYEEATKRLLAAGGSEADAVSLYVELVRSRQARNDVDGAARALREMAGAPRGAWLARVLEAFLPPAEESGEPDPERTVSSSGTRSRAAVEELAALENDPDLSRGLSLVAAIRALQGADPAAARKQLRDLAARDGSDALVTAFLGDLDRAAGDHEAAARVAADAAVSTHDTELAATLHLEAASERWRSGDRKGAIEEIDAALTHAPEAAKTMQEWASRGVDVDSLEGRRRATERASVAGGTDGRVLALERFATEVGGGDPDDAAAALAAIDAAPEGDLGLAGALARLAWSGAAGDTEATREAIVRVASRGPRALLMATAEQVRMAREADDPEELARAASRWFDAGGGLAAALEWLAATLVLENPAEEKRARLGLAAALSGDARESLLASAALLDLRLSPYDPAPLVVGSSAAVRLANLELSAPGCDPRRRSAALVELGDALGEDAGVDAVSMAGWSALAAADAESARAAFEKAVAARPGDLAAWEGLRACGEQSGDKALRARAAAELGARCADARRGAAFWEEAALTWLELGDEAQGETALEASFARDSKRGVAFDKLFRRVRARKENDKLLELITRRLEATDEPQEIQKLFWEQARVLREKGDQDGALHALEHVTMLEPDHVGALALLGEINIRRGNFEQAAESLARLAVLDGAPPKSRMTAGVAAVDLYENKLDRFDKALEILVALHAANLSSLPVRERLARAAARTGSWREATSILEELMHERPEADGRIEAARLAMAIHRDRLSQPQGAAAAIVKLLEEAPTDGEALDMLLQTEHPPDVRERLLKNARATLVATLQKRPTDVTTVRRLVRVSRALGDDAQHQAALGALLSLGAGDAQNEQALTLLAGKKARAPQIAIGEATMRSILAPGDEGPLSELFVLLGPTLAEALGPNLQACGVTKRDKVDPRSGLALRNEVSAWAGAFGVREFDLYVGGKEPLGVQGIAGETPALVVGSGVNTPLTPVTRARIARELLAMVRGTTVTRSRDDMTIAAIVVAACRQAEVPIEQPPYAMLVEVERLIGKAIARKTRKAMAETCRAIVRSGADAKVWSKRALASHDRVATVASGDASVVLSDVLGVATDKLGPAVKGSARAEELLRFVLSPLYLELRRSLGLEDGA